MGLADGDPDGVTSAFCVRKTGALGRAKDRSPKLGEANGLAATGRAKAGAEAAATGSVEVVRKDCVGAELWLGCPDCCKDLGLAPSEVDVCDMSVCRLEAADALLGY